MRKYPIGIQDFQELRKGGYLYIDKTREIYELIESGKYYFLSRPRRFGKSLLISTLKYLFQGGRELFEGLWIKDKHDFRARPVLHISISSIGYKTMGLAPALNAKMDYLAAAYNIELKRKTYDQKFAELLEKLSGKKTKVALLIDEYDKPLVDYIDQPEQAEINRDILKNFFSIIKDADPFLRFLLITGVSKFSKVSLFSDLNHLRDITLVEQFETIAGYTQAELENSFAPDIQRFAQKLEKPADVLKEEIRRWYNGYSWGTETRLYNPFSILNLFASQRFANYWWETGTPTFLVKRLKEGFHYDLEGVDIGSDVFESYTLENLNWQSLLFQTGYLTIQEYHREERLFTLGYPNLEVKEAMHRHLLGAFRESDKSESQALFVGIKRSLESGNLERLIALVNTLFSSIPYQLFQQKQEAFFHAVLHLAFSGVGLLVASEVSTAKGRVDTVVHTKNRIYVMEFKLDASAESALEQIRDKRYGNPFLSREKEVIALGVNFSSAEKEVDEWRAVPYLSLLADV